MKFNRIFLIILDGLGNGEAMDADKYQDKGVNTLNHLIEKEGLFLPNLKKLGLLNTLSMNKEESEAYYTIARPKNPNNNVLCGHYELMCVNEPFIYPYTGEKFKRELLEKIASLTQRPIIGNVIGNGQDIIQKLYQRQLETNALIIYTTGDSNLIVAANEELISKIDLENICQQIRNILVNDNEKVSMVISQPFTVEDKKVILDEENHYYTLNPPTLSCLDTLKNSNLQVISIGKTNEIFNGMGINKIVNTNNNNDATNKLLDIIEKSFNGLCIVNLDDFDKYGHRLDSKGFKDALEEFDVQIPLILNKLNLDDLLIITGLNGNDPTIGKCSHTRENVPVILYSRGFNETGQLDILNTYADIGATIVDIFDLDNPWIGTSFLDKLK